MNNPNRYTNANRVNRIGTVSLNIDDLIKQEKPPTTDAGGSNDVVSSNESPTLMSQRSSTSYIPNGNYLTMQTLDVPPMLTISHFQGYN